MLKTQALSQLSRPPCRVQRVHVHVYRPPLRRSMSPLVVNDSKLCPCTGAPLVVVSRLRFTLCRVLICAIVHLAPIIPCHAIVQSSPAPPPSCPAGRHPFCTHHVSAWRVHAHTITSGCRSTPPMSHRHALCTLAPLTCLPLLNVPPPPQMHPVHPPRAPARPMHHALV